MLWHDSHLSSLLSFPPCLRSDFCSVFSFISLFGLGASAAFRLWSKILCLFAGLSALFLYRARMFAFLELLSFGFGCDPIIEPRPCFARNGLASFVDLLWNTWLEFVELLDP